MSNLGEQFVNRCRGISVMLLVASLTSLATASADEVALTPGTPIKEAIGGKVRGQIVSESLGEVVVQVGGSSVSIPVARIASIRYEGQPPSIQLAEIRKSAGQFKEAAELFHKAAVDAANRPFVAQMAQYEEAESAAELSVTEPDRTADAITKVEQFVRTYPSSRHLASARETLAKLLIRKGEYDGADREIEALAKLAGSSDRASLLRTTVLTRRGKHDLAIVELDRLIAESGKNPVKLRTAQLAKAQSLTGLKRYDDAASLLHSLIQESPAENATVQAPAYNALGDCLREANRPKDALIAYLHTDLLYAKNKEEHPRALFQISRLFRQMKQDGRADEVWQRLKQDYPRSPWLTADSKPR